MPDSTSGYVSPPLIDAGDGWRAVQRKHSFPRSMPPTSSAGGAYVISPRGWDALNEELGCRAPIKPAPPALARRPSKARSGVPLKLDGVQCLLDAASRSHQNTPHDTTTTWRGLYITLLSGRRKFPGLQLSVPERASPFTERLQREREEEINMMRGRRDKQWDALKRQQTPVSWHAQSLMDYESTQVALRLAEVRDQAVLADLDRRIKKQAVSAERAEEERVVAGVQRHEAYQERKGARSARLKKKHQELAALEEAVEQQMRTAQQARQEWDREKKTLTSSRISIDLSGLDPRTGEIRE